MKKYNVMMATALASLALGACSKSADPQPAAPKADAMSSSAPVAAAPSATATAAAASSMSTPANAEKCFGIAAAGKMIVPRKQVLIHVLDKALKIKTLLNGNTLIKVHAKAWVVSWKVKGVIPTITCVNQYPK